MSLGQGVPQSHKKTAVSHVTVFLKITHPNIGWVQIKSTESRCKDVKYQEMKGEIWIYWPYSFLQCMVSVNLAVPTLSGMYICVYVQK